MQTIDNNFTQSKPFKNRFLIAAAMACAAAGLIHIGCIIFGGSWYRFFGAGEEMARLADAGNSYPTIVTSIISAVLSIWSLYALSGAQIIPRLPLLRTALCIITSLLLARGLAFIFMMPLFPGNSLLFWLTSSALCLAIGICFLIGLKQSWHQLG